MVSDMLYPTVIETILKLRDISIYRWQKPFGLLIALRPYGHIASRQDVGSLNIGISKTPHYG